MAAENSAALVDPAKAVILSCPSGGPFRCERLSRTSLCVGRATEDQPVDLDLSPDPRVSRSHVRLFQEGKAWFLEDLGSAHGTFLDGCSIGGQGPVPIAPGAIIRTGNTTWTFYPSPSLLAWRNRVLIRVVHTGAVNLALFQSGVPFLGETIAKNFGRRRSRPSVLTLRIPGYADPDHVKVPALDSGSEAVLGPAFLRFDPEPLKRQPGVAQAQLRIEIDGHPAPQAGEAVPVLGFWDWWNVEEAVRSIAAFVAPRNPFVEGIVNEAQRFEAQPFARLLESGCEDSVALTFASIYRCLAERRDIRYEYPELRPVPGARGTYQTIRPPHRILHEGALGNRGQGTCLDLAVLMAACLESARLFPLLVLMAGEDGGYEHALAGCWIASVPGARPVLRDVKFLRQQLQAGNLLLAECTGVADGVPGRRGRLTFEEARHEASKELAGDVSICAVDIGALRPPYGDITPMDSSYEPEATRAYEEARRLARCKRREAIEIAHLLYGLLSAGGDITGWIFRRLGLDPNAVRERLAHEIRSHEADKEPIPTRNYSECQWLAERYAWCSGVPSVREQDILWAFLDRSGNSRKMERVFALMGVTSEQLREALALRCPLPLSLPSSRDSGSRI